jgi:uncharacterized protein (DUF1015 family)
MSILKPFRGFRPKQDLVEKIASLPYDVMNSDEAREMAAGNDLSFLHVVKPEIDLPMGTDLHADEVYAKGAENLTKLIESGSLVRDETPCMYLYEQQMGEHIQVGLMGAASVDEYENDLIKKHEHTRPDKEDDRTRHVDELNANAGPVFLTYKADAGIDAMVNDIRKTEPTYNFTADDGIRHALWVISEAALLEKLSSAFSAVPALYVADGHHRSASAGRVRALRRDANPSHTGDEGYNYFMAVCFPHDQLQILPYNRVVADICSHTPDEFLALLTVRFELWPSDTPSPDEPHQFGMYLGGRWYRLKAKPDSFPADDPVRSLDVQILSEAILDKIVNIRDLRTDTRINFVGGIRGTEELERLVDSGDFQLAFAMVPTTIAQLMNVADAGLIMPPKSTWFEPKLRSGVVVRMLDE